MENPFASLLALHPRYVWMLERLQERDVLVSQLNHCKMSS